MPRIFGPQRFEAPDNDDGVRFYLGTHHPYWLWKHPHVSYFISDRRIKEVKTLKETKSAWALDSGGFTEVVKHGRWITGADEYAERIKRYANEVTHLEWAAPQDWICGAKVLKATGLSVQVHQERTVDSVVHLRSKVSCTNVIPVLQGETPEDYLRHAEMYEARGFVLADEPRVGVGSVFNRQDDVKILRLLHRLHSQGMRIHAFGFKLTGLRLAAGYLASADSMAWSYDARRGKRHPDCVDAKHKRCSNCFVYAHEWLRYVQREAPIDESTVVVVRRDGLNGPGLGTP